MISMDISQYIITLHIVILCHINHTVSCIPLQSIFHDIRILSHHYIPNFCPTMASSSKWNINPQIERSFDTLLVEIDQKLSGSWGVAVNICKPSTFSFCRTSWRSFSMDFRPRPRPLLPPFAIKSGVAEGERGTGQGQGQDISSWR